MSTDFKVSQTGAYVPPTVQVEGAPFLANNGNAAQIHQPQAPAQNGSMSSAASIEAQIKALAAQKAAIEAEYQQQQLALLQKMNSPEEIARQQQAAATVAASIKLPDPTVLLQQVMAQQNMRWELPDGIYQGQMKGGRPHGHGTLTYRLTNDRKRQMYEGDFVEGQMHGKGVMVWQDGDRYTGTFKNGEITGSGTFEKGRWTYTGYVVNGNYEGQGKLTWSGGKTWVGNFKEDKLHGYGEYTYGETTYKGNWENDKYHGEGELHEPSHLTHHPEYITKGTFRNGKIWDGTKVLVRSSITHYYRNGEEVCCPCDCIIL